MFDRPTDIPTRPSRSLPIVRWPPVVSTTRQPSLLTPAEGKAVEDPSDALKGAQVKKRVARDEPARWPDQRSRRRYTATQLLPPTEFEKVTTDQPAAAWGAPHHVGGSPAMRTNLSQVGDTA
jgi:hypothetical protein